MPIVSPYVCVKVIARWHIMITGILLLDTQDSKGRIRGQTEEEK